MQENLRKQVQELNVEDLQILTDMITQGQKAINEYTQALNNQLTGILYFNRFPSDTETGQLINDYSSKYRRVGWLASKLLNDLMQQVNEVQKEKLNEE